MVHRRARLCLFVASAAIIVHPLVGSERECGWTAGVFDPVAGSDPGHYAPDRLVEYKHLRLELDFDDPSAKSFTGEAIYTIRAITSGVHTLRLHAMNLAIESVHREDGGPLPFEYDGKLLTVEVGDALPTDTDRRIVVGYACTNPIEGMHFVAPDETYPNRPAQVHTLGQPEFNRYWFPCHDFPNQRSTTEMIVTVPKGYNVLSNGRMVSQRGDGERVTFHWRQDQPHVAYLVSLVIGKFSVVTDQWRDVPLSYWVPRGREADARRTFARTPEMLTFYSELFGRAYPYDQYAQACVWRFKIGGMEHTSATTMFDQILIDERAALDHDQDGLIAHEMVHQWFGDMITCRTWAHIWLNEGFATFFDELWYEHWKGRDRLLYDVWLKYQNVAAAESAEEPDALVWNRYTRPHETFSHKGYMPYGKGSSLLHMLRHRLGDTVFFAGIRDYVRTFAYRSVETNDFRRVMERASGRTLEAFFTQWAFQPGVPRLDISYTWDAPTNTARIVVRQTQPIDDDHPAYSVPLDLYFRSEGDERRTTVRLRRRKDVFTRRFDERPDMFCVDPDAGLLKTVRIAKPRPMWLTQLVEGPTVATRCEAARHLSSNDRPEVVAKLRSVASSGDEFWGVRAQAAKALGVMRSDRARSALIGLLTDESLRTAHKVRLATVEALGEYVSKDATRVLRELAANDPSDSVAAAATRGLGNARGLDVFETIRTYAERDSYRDEIRVAVVQALGNLGDPRGVAVCEDIAAYGHHPRTRPEALEALARLASRGIETERIERLLIATLSDPERRARAGAIRGLGRLCGLEGDAALRRLARDEPRRDLAAAARSAVNQLMGICEQEKAVGFLYNELKSLHVRSRRLSERIGERESGLDIWSSGEDDRDVDRDE